jgi:hypothetical protein
MSHLWGNRSYTLGEGWLKAGVRLFIIFDFIYNSSC